MSDPFAQQRLDGKVLIVTGSTQGLGAEIARRAARLGAVTGSVIDFDQTVHGPYGEHVPPTEA